MLMAIPDAQILELSEAGIRRVDYRDTAHFQTMKYFLNNPEGVLNELLRT